MFNRITNIILHVLVATLFLAVPVIMTGFVVQVYCDLATTYGSAWGWGGATIVGLFFGWLILVAFHDIRSMGRR